MRESLDVDVLADGYADARRHIQAQDWERGLDAFRAAEAAGATPAARDRLLAEIARIRLAADDDGAAEGLDGSLIREANGEALVRRLLVDHFHRTGRLRPLVSVLERLLQFYPALVDMRRVLVNALARLGRMDEAVRHMDTAAAAATDDLAIQTSRVQLRLLANRNDEATAIALELAPRLTQTSAEAHIIMQALLRGGRVKEAGGVAASLDPVLFANRHVAATATQALFAAGMTKRAIAAGEAAIAAGHDTESLRSNIGEAMLRSVSGDAPARAIEHLGAGVALAPQHARANALYGEALLRAGRSAEAIGFLEKAITPETRSPMTRSLYARALRYNGRHSEAADQYLQLVAQTPERWATYRQAVGVLSQAGRHAEASKVFRDMISRRERNLAPSFETALAELNDKLDTAVIPQARMDWAWSLRRGQDDMDRAEWERRARWGLLSDLLIIDWLECREQQAEEAMTLLADLNEADRILEPLRGQGFVIATAHVGPLFSGPILLELCGVPSRWVASTPSIADAHYAASVISTSHQTDAQVARACLKSLQAGYAVSIAVDGSSKMGSPKIRFEGQDINYSPFAAQVAHRLRIPSLFYASRWENGRLAYQAERLPTAEPDEELGPFAARWRDAFLGHLRNHLAGAPENLRMAGGLWAAIRPAS